MCKGERVRLITFTRVVNWKAYPGVIILLVQSSAFWVIAKVGVGGRMREFCTVVEFTTLLLNIVLPCKRL